MLAKPVFWYFDRARDNYFTFSDPQVIEEGGSLLNVSEINWVQATDNIYTFSTEFLAPTQEGFYER